MEFGDAGWTIRAYGIDRSGVPAGAAVYNRRAFIDWGLGSAGDTEEGRRFQQSITATCPLDYAVEPGQAARIIHLLHVNEERWFNVDGIARDPSTNTMMLSLETRTWSTAGVTD